MPVNSTGGTGRSFLTTFVAETPLQAALVATMDMLDNARAKLGAREYDALLDIILIRIARDYVARLGFDESEEQAA